MAGAPPLELLEMLVKVNKSITSSFKYGCTPGMKICPPPYPLASPYLFGNAHFSPANQILMDETKAPPTISFRILEELSVVVLKSNLLYTVTLVAKQLCLWVGWLFYFKLAPPFLALR